MGQLDIRPGCIVLIAGFDDIPEHEFRIEEIYEEFVTGMALSGPFAGEYGEPDKEMIVKTHLSRNNSNRDKLIASGKGLNPALRCSYSQNPNSTSKPGQLPQ